MCEMILCGVVGCGDGMYAVVECGVFEVRLCGVVGCVCEVRVVMWSGVLR